MKKIIFFLMFGSVVAQNQRLDSIYIYQAEKERDPSTVVDLYTKALQHCIPNSCEERTCYLYRGWEKYDIPDYQGCIEDITKGLSIHADTCILYPTSGIAFKEEIEAPKFYYRLALAYFSINDEQNGCQYLSKAILGGYKEAYEIFNRYCRN